jgi:hypothetical protein
MLLSFRKLKNGLSLTAICPIPVAVPRIDFCFALASAKSELVLKGSHPDVVPKFLYHAAATDGCCVLP